MPPVRNAADLLTDPRWFKLWEANLKERDSWISTKTGSLLQFRHIRADAKRDVRVHFHGRSGAWDAFTRRGTVLNGHFDGFLVD